MVVLAGMASIWRLLPVLPEALWLPTSQSSVHGLCCFQIGFMTHKQFEYRIFFCFALEV